MAHYDLYDYSAYWKGREYEHDSEVVAIKALLAKVSKIDKTIEVGGGFGRLVPSYVYRSKSILLTDPSNKLLSLAKDKLAGFKNVRFMQSTLDNLPEKLRGRRFDLVVMVRVMHHLENADKSFDDISRLISPNGFLVLEFANKIHFKKVVSEFLKGNFNFAKNMEKIDVRSEKSKKQGTISFLNYHPNVIKEELAKYNFEIIETRSVSNIRSVFLKKYLPEKLLVEIEKILQIPFSYFYFGPSIFILAHKKG